jgi:parvulin-like peptidyl-prolyl isomerase
LKIKNFNRLILVTLLGVLLCIIGCQNKRPDSRKVIARVGNEYLTRDIINELIPENITEEERDIFQKNLIDRWIEKQILRQAALDEGIEFSQRDNWQLENLKMDIFAQKLLNSKISAAETATDKEIEDYYSANQGSFTRDKDEVHIVQLFLEKLDRTIRNEITKSNSLQDVIEKNFLIQQINNIVEPNGDLGYVEIASLRPVFARAIRGKKTGIIYGPIKTSDGYHYIQVLDRQEAGSVRELDLVRDEIIKQIKIEKRQQKIRALKEQLKKDADVETFYTNLQ